MRQALSISPAGILSLNSKRQILGWVVLVAVLTIAMAAAASIIGLRQQAHKFRRAHILMLSLEAQTNRLGFLEHKRWAGSA